MPTLDQLTPMTRRANIYYAVIEHCRSHHSDDVAGHNRIAAIGGVLDAQGFRTIGGKYWISRRFETVSRHGVIDANAVDTATYLSTIVLPLWPFGLVPRSTLCSYTVMHVKAQGWSREREFSAISKFMWFLRPKGWTPFDTYSSTSLGVGTTHGDPPIRFADFYAKLHRRNFSGVSVAIQSALNNAGFSYLYGERVIDKALLLAGAPGTRWRSNIIRKGRSFLRSLPRNAAIDLQALARRIAVSFDHDPFFTAPV